MKTLFLIFSVMFVSQAAVANMYAPKLNDIVVLYDVDEGDFSPFFFHKIMGEAHDLKMHSTCPRIQIDEQSQVLCVSDVSETPVGLLGPKVGQDGTWAMYSVEWFSNVEILEEVEVTGLSYSVKLK